MAIDHNQSSAAKEKAFRMLEEAEKQRAMLRFQRGLDDLIGGKLDVLKNTEFKQKIAENLFGLLSRGEREKVERVLDVLFENSDYSRYAESIQEILDTICSQSLAGYNIKLLQYLSPKFCDLLTDRECKYVVSATLRDWMAKTCGIFVRSSLWKDYELLLTTIRKIRNRSFQTEEGKDHPFRNIFPEIVSKDVVEKLLRRHLTVKTDDFAGKSIAYLGDEAILYLLNRLVFSREKDERFQILELLADYGESIVKVLHSFMEEDLPWYAVRNLVSLVGEIGNAEYYSLVEGYLIHPDQRVQKQVVSCIVKLGGKDMEKRLILALPVVDDDLKMKVAMQLGGFSSEETATGILGIIKKRGKISQEIRWELIRKLCVSLRSYPYQRVVDSLKILKNEVKDKKQAGLLITIDETILRLQSMIRHLSKEEKAEKELLSYDFDPENDYGDFAGIDDFMQEMEALLEEGKVEKASERIYKKICELARQKDFQSAEQLRDKLLEINPDALQDVMRAAELIEEEKNSPSSTVQVEIWQELFERLSGSEYDFLISALRGESYSKDEHIVSIGEIDQCLYFINSGVVRLTCRNGDRETFLKRLRPGDIVGVNPFFNASVWTVSVVAQQNTKLLVLRRERFSGHERFPKLEEKLHEFCKSKNTIPALLKMSGQDRRNNARYSVNVSMSNILLDPYGSKDGRRSFQGEMLDISRGGLSFAIRIAKRENAQKLLGRQIISEIGLKGKEMLRCFGIIVGVNYQNDLLKEYTVHVRFYRELEQNRVTDVLNLVI